MKILDFGLARLAAPDDEGRQPTPRITDPGTVLGTAGYMAPEQVRGQPVDGRADLFALGVVLYEMVTGQRAFARESTVETLNAILKEDPPELTTKRADLPPALDRIVRHCLEKNPARTISIGARRDLRARDAERQRQPQGRAAASTVAPPPHEASSRARAWRGRSPRSPTAALAAAIVLPRTSRAALHGTARFLAIGAPHSVSSHMRPRRSRLTARLWRSGRRTRLGASSCGCEIWQLRRRARCPIR